MTPGVPLRRRIGDHVAVAAPGPPLRLGLFYGRYWCFPMDVEGEEEQSSAIKKAIMQKIGDQQSIEHACEVSVRLYWNPVPFNTT